MEDNILDCVWIEYNLNSLSDSKGIIIDYIHKEVRVLYLYIYNKIIENLLFFMYLIN